MAFSSVYLVLLNYIMPSKVFQKELILSANLKTVSENILPLFELTGLEVPVSLNDAIRSTQEKWLRPKGLERWESSDYLALDESQKEKALTVFRSKLAMVAEVAPSRREYDYGIILGATVKTLRARFAHLLHQVEANGLRFRKVFFLVGEREVSPELETKEAILGLYRHGLPIRKGFEAPAVLPKTETEMAKLIVEQTKFRDKSFKERIFFIDTKKQKTKSGAFRRPNTADTVKAWLATKPKKGTLLFISSNPHCGYQSGVVENLFPGWDLETVGAASSADTKIEIYFDALARWLYQYRNL